MVAGSNPALGTKHGVIEIRISNIFLPEPYYEMLNDLVRDGYFPNRSEAIREAVRLMLLDYGRFTKWLTEKRKQDLVLNKVMEGATQNRAKRVP